MSQKINSNSNLHEIAITALVRKKDKYLLVRRSPNKKRFPGYWTAPGGKLEVQDYTGLKKDPNLSWTRYSNVLEKTLTRELKEEVGIKVRKIEYLASAAVIHQDGNPSIIISCSADYVSGKIRLQQEENDKYAWVTLRQAKKYQLLGGIYEELKLAERKRT